jgi:outer membrane protein assembly factor BamB
VTGCRWMLAAAGWALVATVAWAEEPAPLSALPRPTELWRVSGASAGDGIGAAARTRDLIFARGGGFLVAIETATGKERWKVPAPTGTHGPLSAVGPALIAPSHGHLSAFQIRTGAALWTVDTGCLFPAGLQTAGPAHAVALCVEGFGAQRKTSVVACELSTGKRLWRFRPGRGPGAGSGRNALSRPDWCSG